MESTIGQKRKAYEAAISNAFYNYADIREAARIAAEERAAMAAAENGAQPAAGGGGARRGGGGGGGGGASLLAPLLGVSGNGNPIPMRSFAALRSAVEAIPSLIHNDALLMDSLIEVNATYCSSAATRHNPFRSAAAAPTRGTTSNERTAPPFLDDATISLLSKAIAESDENTNANTNGPQKEPVSFTRPLTIDDFSAILGALILRLEHRLHGTAGPSSAAASAPADPPLSRTAAAVSPAVGAILDALMLTLENDLFGFSPEGPRGGEETVGEDNVIAGNNDESDATQQQHSPSEIHKQRNPYALSSTEGSPHRGNRSLSTTSITAGHLAIFLTSFGLDGDAVAKAILNIHRPSSSSSSSPATARGHPAVSCSSFGGGVGEASMAALENRRRTLLREQHRRAEAAKASAARTAEAKRQFAEAEERRRRLHNSSANEEESSMVGDRNRFRLVGSDGSATSPFAQQSIGHSAHRSPSILITKGAGVSGVVGEFQESHRHQRKGSAALSLSPIASSNNNNKNHSNNNKGSIVAATGDRDIAELMAQSRYLLRRASVAISAHGEAAAVAAWQQFDQNPPASRSGGGEERDVPPGVAVPTVWGQPPSAPSGGDEAMANSRRSGETDGKVSDAEASTSRQHSHSEGAVPLQGSTAPPSPAALSSRSVGPAEQTVRTPHQQQQQRRKQHPAREGVKARDTLTKEEKSIVIPLGPLAAALEALFGDASGSTRLQQHITFSALQDEDLTTPIGARILRATTQANSLLPSAHAVTTTTMTVRSVAALLARLEDAFERRVAAEEGRAAAYDEYLTSAIATGDLLLRRPRHALASASPVASTPTTAPAPVAAGDSASTDAHLQLSTDPKFQHLIPLNGPHTHGDVAGRNNTGTNNPNNTLAANSNSSTAATATATAAAAARTVAASPTASDTVIVLSPSEGEAYLASPAYDAQLDAAFMASDGTIVIIRSDGGGGAADGDGPAAVLGHLLLGQRLNKQRSLGVSDSRENDDSSDSQDDNVGDGAAPPSPAVRSRLLRTLVDAGAEGVDVAEMQFLSAQRMAAAASAQRDDAVDRRAVRQLITKRVLIAEPKSVGGNDNNKDQSTDDTFGIDVSAIPWARRPTVTRLVPLTGASRRASKEADLTKPSRHTSVNASAPLFPSNFKITASASPNGNSYDDDSLTPMGRLDDWTRAQLRRGRAFVSPYPPVNAAEYARRHAYIRSAAHRRRVERRYAYLRSPERTMGLISFSTADNDHSSGGNGFDISTSVTASSRALPRLSKEEMDELSERVEAEVRRLFKAQLRKNKNSKSEGGKKTGTAEGSEDNSAAAPPCLSKVNNAQYESVDETRADADKNDGDDDPPTLDDASLAMHLAACDVVMEALERATDAGETAGGIDDEFSVRQAALTAAVESRSRAQSPQPEHHTTKLEADNSPLLRQKDTKKKKKKEAPADTGEGTSSPHKLTSRLLPSLASATHTADDVAPLNPRQHVLQPAPRAEEPPNPPQRALSHPLAATANTAGQQRGGGATIDGTHRWDAGAPRSATAAARRLDVDPDFFVQYVRHVATAQGAPRSALYPTGTASQIRGKWEADSPINTKSNNTNSDATTHVATTTTPAVGSPARTVARRRLESQRAKEVALVEWARKLRRDGFQI